MTNPELRVSSTSIGTYLGCPRMYAYELNTGQTKKANEAMAFGTLVHACIEYRLADPGRRWPTKAQVVKMKGNYDDPKLALIYFPHLWEEVEQMLDFLVPEDYVGSGEFHIEWSLDDAGVYACDGAVQCGGFVDLLDLENKTIWDWKTRSDLRYAPKTREDFLDNPQLMYYAAAIAQQFDLPYVHVGHINLIRPSRWRPKSSKVAVYTHRISRWYLDASWAVLTQDIFPSMLAIKRKGDPLLAERNNDMCYKYGKNTCAFLSQCPTSSETGPNPMTSLLSAIRDARGD